MRMHREYLGQKRDFTGFPFWSKGYCVSSGHCCMVNNAAYHANEFLAKALKKLNKDKFERMIVFLGWENVDCTNNHVERNNRVFHTLQKTSDKRRKDHTIEKALDLDL